LRRVKRGLLSTDEARAIFDDALLGLEGAQALSKPRDFVAESRQLLELLIEMTAPKTPKR
jgi:hypothetical protein